MSPSRIRNPGREAALLQDALVGRTIAQVTTSLDQDGNLGVVEIRTTHGDKITIGAGAIVAWTRGDPPPGTLHGLPFLETEVASCV